MHDFAYQVTPSYVNVHLYGMTWKEILNETGLNDLEVEIEITNVIFLKYVWSHILKLNL